MIRNFKKAMFKQKISIESQSRHFTILCRYQTIFLKVIQEMEKWNKTTLTLTLTLSLTLTLTPRTTLPPNLSEKKIQET